MSGEGYIRLARKIFEHPFWKAKTEYDQFDAWIDLIQRSNFTGNRVVINNQFITLNRGELVASVRFLAREWGWSANRVKRYLELLRSDGMIDTRTDQGITVIKLCKYEHYNKLLSVGEHSNEHTADTGRTQSEHTTDTGRIQDEHGANTRQKKENKVNKDNKVNKVNNNIEEPLEKEKIKRSSLKILDEENTRKKLREEFPQIDVDEEIAKMKDWLLANGKIKKDYPAYARNWLRRRRETSHDQPGRSNRPARFKTQEDDNTEKIGNTPIETIRKAKAILDATPEGSSTIMSGIPQGWKSDGW